MLSEIINNIISNIVVRYLMLFVTIIVVLIIGYTMKYFISKRPESKTYSELMEERKKYNIDQVDYLNKLSGDRRTRRIAYYNNEFKNLYFCKVIKNDPLLQIHGNLPQFMAQILPDNKIVTDFDELSSFLENLSNMKMPFMLGIENFSGDRVYIKNNIQKNKLEINKDFHNENSLEPKYYDYDVDLKNIVKNIFVDKSTF